MLAVIPTPTAIDQANRIFCIFIIVQFSVVGEVSPASSRNNIGGSGARPPIGGRLIFEARGKGRRLPEMARFIPVRDLLHQILTARRTMVTAW